MTKKISAFAIMACLASSLALASDKAKSRSSVDDAKATAAQAAISDEAQRDGDSPRKTVKHKKKDKRNAKPAPSDQEREFDRVLLGIYG